MHDQRQLELPPPVASPMNVTKSLKLLVSADRGDLLRFATFETGVHELPRHDRAPVLDPALERPQLTVGEPAGVSGLEPFEQRFCGGVGIVL